MNRLAFIRNPALVILALAAIAPGPVLAQHTGTAGRDWQSTAFEANQGLAAALEDSARGRSAEAKLRSALAAFSDLLTHAPLSDRDRARVLYNRALTHLALRDPAAAIFDLRRADALAPGCDSTRRELEAARAALVSTSNTAGEAPDANQPAHAPAPIAHPAESIWNGVRRVDPGLRWTVGVAAFATGWLLLAPTLFTAARPVRRPLFAAAAAALAFSALAIGTLVAEHRLAPKHPEVVVLAEACQPRAGPDVLAYQAATFNGRANIPRGTELAVVETRTLPENPSVVAWLKVRDRSADTSGPSVWIPADAVGWVRPPLAPTPDQLTAHSSAANAPM